MLILASKTQYYKFFPSYPDKNSYEYQHSSLTLSPLCSNFKLHVRGGAIIPMQEPALTTTVTRNNSFSLLVALDDQGAATGDFFWDDGRSLEITRWDTYIHDEWMDG